MLTNTRWRVGNVCVLTSAAQGNLASRCRYGFSSELRTAYKLPSYLWAETRKLRCPSWIIYWLSNASPEQGHHCCGLVTTALTFQGVDDLCESRTYTQNTGLVSSFLNQALCRICLTLTQQHFVHSSWRCTCLGTMPCCPLCNGTPTPLFVAVPEDPAPR